MSQSGSLVASSGTVPSNVAQAYITDAGTAIPSANVLNVLGSGGTSTSGSGNTVTIFSSPLSPLANVSMVDDFINGGNLYGWSNSGFTGNANGTVDNPGLLKNSDVTPAYITLSSQYHAFVLGGGTLSANFVFKFGALSAVGNSYTAYVGLITNSGGAPTETDGVYFSYTDGVNSGNWVLNCSNSSVTTSVNTSTAASTSYVNLGVVINAAGTSATFFIDGVQVGTPIATNIPTTSLAPAFHLVRSSGALPVNFIDLFYLSLTLTNPRPG